MINLGKWKRFQMTQEEPENNEKGKKKRNLTTDRFEQLKITRGDTNEIGQGYWISNEQKGRDLHHKNPDFIQRMKG